MDEEILLDYVKTAIAAIPVMIMLLVMAYLAFGGS